MTTTDVTLDQVLALARRLQPVDQARLILRLAPTIEHLITQSNQPTAATYLSLRGFLADLGPAPSDADITAAQQEMWATFPSDPV